MTTVNREDLPEDYAEMMQKESHHHHEIVLENEVLRWRADPFVRETIGKEISLNDLCPVLARIGHGKN